MPNLVRAPDPVSIESLRIRVDVSAEWKQILGEAWRLQRDFYWAPNMGPHRKHASFHAITPPESARRSADRAGS